MLWTNQQRNSKKNSRHYIVTLLPGATSRLFQKQHFCIFLKLPYDVAMQRWGHISLSPSHLWRPPVGQDSPWKTAWGIMLLVLGFAVPLRGDIIIIIKGVFHASGSQSEDVGSHRGFILTTAVLGNWLELFPSVSWSGLHQGGQILIYAFTVQCTGSVRELKIGYNNYQSNPSNILNISQNST